jgi:hypothetical protein
MAQRVEVPGVGTLEFPDGMSQQDMAAAIHQNFPQLGPPSTAKDVAKSVPSGAAKGMINLAGAPADLWEFLTGAMAKGVGQFTSPEFAEELKKAAKPELPLPNSKRIRDGVESVTGPLHEPQTRAGKFTGGVMEATAAGVPFGKAATALSSIAGLSSETAGAVTDDNPWAKAVAGFFGPMAAHAGAAYRSAPGNMIRQATGDVTEMQWEAARKHMEKAKALGIDLAAPEAMPTSSIQQLASDVAASKEGGRVFNRFLANRPPQVANSVNSNLLSQIGIDDAPDVNMARAKDAADRVISGAEKFRTEATRPYYLAQKKSDIEGMLLESRFPGLKEDAQRAYQSYADLLQQRGQFQTMQAENLTRADRWAPVPGMPRLSGRYSAFPERASEAASAADDVAGRIAPSRENMNKARQAADEVGSALAAKGYDRVREGLESVIGNIDAEIAVAGKNSEKAAILTDLRNKLAPNGIPLDKPYKVESVYQEASKRLHVPINAPSSDRIAAGVLGEHVSALDDLIRQSSPTLKQGRELYREMTERVVEPLTSGPVGRVAGKQGFDPSVPQTLNPVQAIADAKVARPENIRELYTHLNKQDPKAFPGIAKTYLENAFDQAAQKVQAGDNRMVGANFAKAVFGTPQEEANLLEVMRGVAKANGKDPDELVRGTKNLMEILQSTGKIPGVGSPTGGRVATNELAKRSTFAAGLEMVSAAPLAPISARIREWAMGGNYRRLAEILTAPDSIDRIIKIGKYKPTTVTSQALAVSLLEANGEVGSGR